MPAGAGAQFLAIPSSFKLNKGVYLQPGTGCCGQFAQTWQSAQHTRTLDRWAGGVRHAGSDRAEVGVRQGGRFVPGLLPDWSSSLANQIRPDPPSALSQHKKSGWQHGPMSTSSGPDRNGRRAALCGPALLSAAAFARCGKATDRHFTRRSLSPG